MKSKFTLLFLNLLVIFSSCNKAVKKNVSNDVYFLHVFPNETDNACLNISPTADKGYLLIHTTANIGSGSGSLIMLSKINTNGSLEWTKVLPDTIYNPQVTNLKDGTILINSYNYYSKFIGLDKEGNVSFRSNYKSTKQSIGYSYPIGGEDGNIYVSQSNGWFTQGSSTNMIRKYESNGNYLGVRSISDATFGGKISDMFIYKYENPETYFLLGTIYPYPYATLHNPRLFVSKLQYTGNSITAKKTVILDPDNKWNMNYYNPVFLAASDGSLIYSMIQISNENKSAHVYKVDKNLNPVWDFIFKIPGFNVSTLRCAQELATGNYLMIGDCVTDYKDETQPFAAVISPGGNIIWNKTTILSASGRFESSFELSNGSLIFGGTTGGFGNGLNKQDVFMMKTDNQGNLK